MVKLPEGYSLEWSGQYEYMVRAKERLTIVIPVTLLIVIVLLYFNTRNVAKIAIVLLAVPFSLIGAFWLIYLLGYNMSVAVWVGIIALAGVDAETGVVMLLYLDHAFDRFKGEGRMNNLADLQEAVEDGAVKRIRPKMMTVMAILLGLLPIMWSTGAGSDVMKRIAAPMVGGVITSFILELLIYPVIFTIWKWHSEVKPALARRTGRRHRREVVMRSSRVITGVLAAGIMLLRATWATGAGAPFELTVTKDQLIGSSRGTLRFTEEGVQYDTTEKKDARTWAYGDIKQLQVLSPTRIAVLTYEDQGRLKLGADRTFTFDVVRVRSRRSSSGSYSRGSSVRSSRP